MMAYRNKKNAGILNYGLDSIAETRDRSASKRRQQGNKVRTLSKNKEGSFPDNYDYYVAKSSMFSKIGNDIVGKGKSRLEQPGYAFKQTGIGNVIDDLMQNVGGVLPILPVQIEDITYNGGEEVQMAHLAIWDLMLDLELNSDNKVYLKNVVKKLTNYINDDMVKFSSSDMFSSGNLSKAYIKLLKIISLLLLFLNFVILDFNYEANVKMNIKKIIINLNEYMITIVENYVPSERLTDLFKEKLKKVSKNHKIKKNKDFVATLGKNLDLVITNLKQFSKYYII